MFCEVDSEFSSSHLKREFEFFFPALRNPHITYQGNRNTKDHNFLNRSLVKKILFKNHKQPRAVVVQQTGSFLLLPLLRK